MNFTLFLSTKILRQIDTFLSPPKNYANFTYRDRLNILCKDVFSARFTLKKFLNFIMLLLMIVLSYLLFPLSWILKKRGFHFIDIDLDQIGSVTYFDLLLREIRVKGKTEPKKILALASHYTDGNKYLLNLYKSHVTLVRNPFLKFILSPFFVSRVFQDDSSYRFDFVYHTETVAHNIWNTYNDAYQRPLVEIPKTDLKLARKILEPHIQLDKPFVALHVRDNGFYNIPSQNTRNADINSYKTTIKYLISKGYSVIRLGDKNMVDIRDLANDCGPMLFDYAHSDIRSEMLDCFWLSQSAFVIGCASGPSSVPPVFGVNCVNVNWYNASNAAYFLDNDLATFKKFRYANNDSLVPFKELMKPPFSLNASQQTLDDIGVYFQDNTSEEILDTVKEFLEIKHSQPTSLQQHAKSLIRRENYSFSARGNYSNTILRNYFETDID